MGSRDYIGCGRWFWLSPLCSGPAAMRDVNTSTGDRSLPPVADEGRRRSNEQRDPASRPAGALGSLLRIVSVGSSPTVTT